MPKNKSTVFQRLTKVLSPDGSKIIQKQPQQAQRYSIGSEEIFKTTDKSEFEQAKLLTQQNKYLGKVWKKVENGVFQQALNNESTRIGSYSDFEAMEQYPTIGAALDVMMEESTTNNQKGKIMNIYSDSSRVKGILEDLFFNRLDLHTTLPMFIRNMCKYGDNFVTLNIEAGKGVLGAKQMPNYEMERREMGLYNSIYNQYTNNESDNKTKFYWRMHDIEFNSWQVAHFRLLGDDRRLPYGTSVLEKARRIWRQLILSEDSMLVYRVTRAPERRVYKIYVGNIDDDDVEAYVNAIADRFKRLPVVDPQTGQLDLKFNQLSNDQDYFIPVRDENAPNPIDTLPGAQNLNDIADIDYLRANLFTALRVPKPFLGFEDSTGEGKNLALQDIRFSRTINRIQQSAIQELNKIAIIHLYLLGFEDDVNNFTLTLNNPSTQSEMLFIENTQKKVTLFKDATSDLGNGFAAMSMTRGHREIFGWSDDEIKQDLLEQRMEKAAAAELINTANVIKHTGMFDTVDKIYGDYQIALAGGIDPNGGGGDAEGGDGEAGSGGGLGGSFGGGGISGDDIDFTDDGGDVDVDGGADIDAELGGAEGGEESTEEPSEAEAVNENLKKLERKLINERAVLKKQLDSRQQKYQTKYYDRLIDTFREKPINENYTTKMDTKNTSIIEDINSMIKDIDKMLEE